MQVRVCAIPLHRDDGQVAAKVARVEPRNGEAVAVAAAGGGSASVSRGEQHVLPAWQPRQAMCGWARGTAASDTAADCKRPAVAPRLLPCPAPNCSPRQHGGPVRALLCAAAVHFIQWRPAVGRGRRRRNGDWWPGGQGGRQFAQEVQAERWAQSCPGKRAQRQTAQRCFHSLGGCIQVGPHLGEAGARDAAALIAHLRQAEQQSLGSWARGASLSGLALLQLLLR